MSYCISKSSLSAPAEGPKLGDLIHKIRINFENESLAIGPKDLPARIRGSDTNFVCNYEVLIEKRIFRLLQPKAVLYLKSRMRLSLEWEGNLGGTSGGEEAAAVGKGEASDDGKATAPTTTAGAATPVQGPSVPPLSLSFDPPPFKLEGEDASGSPQHLLSPSIQGKKTLEPVKRVIRVGAEFQAFVPASVGPSTSSSAAGGPTREANLPVTDIQTTMVQGVWGAEEVLRFCIAYNKYGKAFSKVAGDVTTKTVQECVGFYYANKYRKDRPYLRDSQVLKQLHGPPELCSLEKPNLNPAAAHHGVSARFLRSPSASVVEPVVPSSDFPIPSSTVASDSDGGSKDENTAPQLLNVGLSLPPDYTTIPLYRPPLPASETETAEPGDVERYDSIDSDSDATGQAIGVATATASGAGDDTLATSEAVADAAAPPTVTEPVDGALKAENGVSSGVQLPEPRYSKRVIPVPSAKRVRKTQLPWCTTCVTTRQAVLPCMWTLCGNTVCRTCYSQHMPAYRSRAVGDSWRGACLNPFWLCLHCGSGKTVPGTKPSPSPAGNGKAAVKQPKRIDSADDSPGDGARVKKKKRTVTAPPVEARALPPPPPAANIRVQADQMSHLRQAHTFLESVREEFLDKPQVYRTVVRTLQLFADGQMSEVDLAVKVICQLSEKPQLVLSFANGFVSPDIIRHIRTQSR